MLNIIINPDIVVYEEITRLVKENNGYCPCVPDKTEDSKCICKAFREQQTVGECHCGRFLKVESELSKPRLSTPFEIENAPITLDSLWRAPKPLSYFTTKLELLSENKKEVSTRMYSNPFFEDVPSIGNLNLEEVIVEDVCPIFFTLVSAKGQRYIASCCELYGEQRWIIAPISSDNLVKLLADKLSIKDAFLTQTDEKCIIAHWSKDNPVMRYEEVASNELPEGDLPIDVMLEAEEGEFAEYIENILGR